MNPQNEHIVISRERIALCDGDWHAAALLGELIYLDQRARANKWHEDSNGKCWHYRTLHDYAEYWQLSENQIRYTLHKFHEKDWIESKRIGNDPKKYFRLTESFFASLQSTAKNANQNVNSLVTKQMCNSARNFPTDKIVSEKTSMISTSGNFPSGNFHTGTKWIKTKEQNTLELLRNSTREKNSASFQRHETQLSASEKNSHPLSEKNNVEKTNKLSEIENKAPNALTTERKESAQVELSTHVKKRRSELKKAPEEYSEGTQLFMHYVERYSHRYSVVLQRDKMASKHCKRVLEYCSNDLELAKLTVDAYLKSNDSWHAHHLLSKLVQETVLEAMRNKALGAQLMTAKQAQRVEKDAYETLVTKTIVEQVESGEYTSDFFSEEELKRLDEATAKKRAEIMERMQIKENSLEKGLIL